MFDDWAAHPTAFDESIFDLGYCESCVVALHTHRSSVVECGKGRERERERERGKGWERERERWGKGTAADFAH